MTRLLAILCIAAALGAADPAELPPLDFVANPPVDGKPAAASRTADNRTTDAQPNTSNAGMAGEATDAADPSAPAMATDEALPAAKNRRSPLQAKTKKPDDGRSDGNPDAPTPIRPADLLADWTSRTVAPPRLAADLVQQRPASAIRPIAAGYQLKAGDVVRLVVWGGQPVNERIPVAPTGDLAVPGFGLVPVGGATAAEAQARVLELVRSHFKQGGAVVAVEQPAAQAVTVVGEVAKPGYLVMPPGGTVLEALAAAGGVLPRGSLRAIRIAVGGQQSEVDLYRVAVDGNADVLQPLPAGALVFVPLAGPQVQVFGAVRRMSGVELKTGEPLAEALRLAGGLSPDADPASVRLLREGQAGQELRQLAAAELANVPVADGDRLLVATRRDLAGASTSIAVRGAVRSPGVYPLRPGLTVAQALALAGGPLPQADVSTMRVVRLLAEPQVVVQDGVPVQVHHATLVGVAGSITLTALDQLVVPERPKADPLRGGVSISGAVGKPGQFAFTPGMTVRDLVLLADRPLPSAQVDRVDLVRSHIDEKGQRTAATTGVDLRPILAGTGTGPELQPGDAVIVRSLADARVQITLEGQFRNTGTFTVPAGTTLSQAIVLAGGLQPEAFPRGARFYRRQEAEIAKQFIADLVRRTEISLAVNKKAALDADDEESKADASRNLARQEAELAQLRTATATGRMAGVDLARLLAGDAGADQLLQDGDRVELPSKPGSVRILGEVMVPGSLVFAPGLTAKELIRRSGGITRQADEDSVFVVRADGSVVATAQGDTLAWDHERRRWARTSLSGLKLEEGDAVIIPADVRYQDSNRRIIRDWSQIMFQVAATVGTIAVLGN